MAAVDDSVDELIEQFHLAQGEFVKGNPESVKRLLSHREDVTLDNPLSPSARGWEQVAWTMERASWECCRGCFPVFALSVAPGLAGSPSLWTPGVSTSSSASSAGSWRCSGRCLPIC